MVEERIGYHRRRAEQEVLLAQRATDCSIAHAHRTLSRLHRDAAKSLEAARPAAHDGHFMLRGSAMEETATALLTRGACVTSGSG